MNIFEELDFKATLDELRHDLPVLKEYYCTVSIALHSYFQELVNAGFTRAEALQIVIAHGYSPESSSLGRVGYIEEEEDE